MGSFKRHMTVLVEGWMHEDVVLAGTDLLIYASIHSMRYDRKGKADNHFLADITGLSQTNVDGVIARFLKDGLLEQRVWFDEDGHKHIEYTTVVPPKKEESQTEEE